MSSATRRLVIVIVALALAVWARAQEHDADTVPSLRCRPLAALSNVLITHSSFFLIDRYLLDEQPYSKVTMHTIHRNLKSPFVWDNDNYFQNQFGHPYQGSIYYNSARRNGYSMLQSMPFVLAGSLMWEYCGESELPSLNDMVTTVASGTMWGELTHRLAGEITDNGDTGGSRVAREVALTILNPMESLHRLISGRMWKVRGGPTTGSSNVSMLSVVAGNRYAVATQPATHGSHLPFVNATLEYGMADGERHLKPFDFFTIDLQLEFGSPSFFSHLGLTGRLCSTPIAAKDDACGEVGLYQYYSYYDSHLSDSVRGPLPFGETASLGPGVMLSLPRLTPKLGFDQRLYAHGVILGTAESDYYQCYKRHYNMGSGYGLSSLSRLKYGPAAMLQLDASYTHLYTWKGYEPANISSLPTDDANDLNVLGDRSQTRLLKVGVQLHAPLAKHLGISLGGTYFSRRTHYRYHPDRHVESYELKAGLEWSL